ncbi:MAG: isopentenyl phosphate kinase family protein [Candidatus Brocadiae bacterium]|nr:isopentenyl phosphate kinase family protein [Candidatus Brocadiia bacterium]
MLHILIKLGGSVITYKDAYPPRANLSCIQRLAQEIRDVWQEGKINLMVVHGAGCFGHIPAHQYRMTQESWHENKRQGAVKIRQFMHDLNQSVVGELVNSGLPAIPFQPSASCLMENKKLLTFPVDIISKYMALGIIPVAYGDIALDTKTGIDILSGDQIVAYIARTVHFDRIVMGSDVDGVFSEDPKKNPHAALIPEITRENATMVLHGLTGSQHIDVTGGMEQKIQELLSLVSTNKTIAIVNALEKGRVKKALSGFDFVGTCIK